jgi:hypothetical protein
VPQNRYALCGFYVVLWDRKSGAEFFYSDTALILLLVCFSSIAFLHRFCRLTPIEAYVHRACHKPFRDTGGGGCYKDNTLWHYGEKFGGSAQRI